jgi:hypothetical protein
VTDKTFLPAKGGFLRHPLGRLIALWALLIVMFLVIWQVLQSPQPGSTHAMPTPAPAGEPIDMFSKVSPVVAIAFFGALFFFSMARTRRFNAANALGLQALAEADYARGADVFGELARKYRWPGQLPGIATFNLGIVRLHQGQFGEALDCFTRVERRRSWSLAGIRASLACQAALAYALRGDIESARRWRAAAEERKSSTPNQALIAGLIAYVDAVVDVREGRYESFLRWLDERWRQLEGGLTARTTRPLRVLRAFATAHAPGAGPRDAGGVDMLVNALKPATPGEFAMLGAEWPEMAAFLSASGL